MKQPMLHTSRLTLRPAVSQDLMRLHALWSQPEVRRFLFDDQDVSLELAETVLDSSIECSSAGYGLWLVHGKEHDEHDELLLGCVGLVPTMTAKYEPALAGLLEVLVAFEVSHWHKGYAREALSVVLEHAFRVLELPMVAAVNDVPNIASERMLNALGFQVLSEVLGPKFPLRTYTLERTAWGSGGCHSMDGINDREKNSSFD